MKPKHLLGIYALVIAATVCFGAELSRRSSASGNLDTRTGFASRVVSGTVRISPIAENDTPAPSLTRVGGFVAGWSKANPF